VVLLLLLFRVEAPVDIREGKETWITTISCCCCAIACPKIPLLLRNSDEDDDEDDDEIARPLRNNSLLDNNPFNRLILDSFLSSIGDKVNSIS
jgi:hypothetical protein